jgi:hypothetical protein
MSAKRSALTTALRDGRLEYEDLGIVTGHGKVFKGAPVDELISKGRLAINKASLRRWFEQLPFEDRPPFLFDEERQSVVPDGSDVVEMNSLKAIALMAHLLAGSSPKFKTGERPNAEAIGRAVNEAAQAFMPGDTRGLQAFNKKIGEALRLFGPEISIHRSR